jgi:hypothetical protein
MDNCFYEEPKLVLLFIVNPMYQTSGGQTTFEFVGMANSLSRWTPGSAMTYNQGNLHWV